MLILKPSRILLRAVVRIALAASTLLPGTLQATPETWPWALPQNISDAHAIVSFKVDSTWHLIEGHTSGLTGRVWLSNPRDLLSVQARIDFPVARFNTGGEMRDERMREVMDSAHSPNVTILVDSLKPECDSATFRRVGSCATRVSTRLQIRGHERPLELRAELVSGKNDSMLRGEARFSWAEFGVEDPSILIARLDPEVVITYSVAIPNAING